MHLVLTVMGIMKTIIDFLHLLFENLKYTIMIANILYCLDLCYLQGPHNGFVWGRQIHLVQGLKIWCGGLATTNMFFDTYILW